MINCKTFVFNPFQENTYLLWNDDREAVLIDPGFSTSSEFDQVLNYINKNGLSIRAVWLTHAHIDHVLGLDKALTFWGCTYHLHELEVAQLKAVEVYAPAYGFMHFRAPDSEGSLLNDNIISLGKERFEVLFLPGHAPGHVGFYHADSQRLWAGDVLFRQSIGRTDLPGGHHATLIQSIQQKLFSLPDEVVVFPGHGPETSIGFEKRNNPFLIGAIV